MSKFLVTVSLHFEIEADSENEAQDIADEVVHIHDADLPEGSKYVYGQVDSTFSVDSTEKE